LISALESCRCLAGFVHSVAENAGGLIANADTPNFKAKDMDFFSLHYNKWRQLGQKICRFNLHTPKTLLPAITGNPFEAVTQYGQRLQTHWDR